MSMRNGSPESDGNVSRKQSPRPCRYMRTRTCFFAMGQFLPRSERTVEQCEGFFRIFVAEIRLTGFSGHSHKCIRCADSARAADLFAYCVAGALIYEVNQHRASTAVHGLRAVLVCYGVPLDRFDHEIGKLLAITADSARRANRVNLDHWITIFIDTDFFRNVGTGQRDTCRVPFRGPRLLRHSGCHGTKARDDDHSLR